MKLRGKYDPKVTYQPGDVVVSEMGGNSYRGDSYARGRSRMTGRYVSRDEGPGYGYNSQDPDGYAPRRY